MSDQALCPTKHCTICRPSFGTDSDEPIYVPLVKRGLVWCCRDCGASYGENPHPSLSSAGSEELRKALEEIRKLSGLDNALSEEASPIVFARMGQIHQHADAALNGVAQGSPGKDAQINRLRYAILGYLEVFDRCGGSESVSPETFAAARQGLREALSISSTDREPPDYGYCLCGRHRDDQCDYCVSLSSPDRGIDATQSCTCTRMIQEAHKPGCPLSRPHRGGASE